MREKAVVGSSHRVSATAEPRSMKLLTFRKVMNSRPSKVSACWRCQAGWRARRFASASGCDPEDRGVPPPNVGSVHAGQTESRSAFRAAAEANTRRPFVPRVTIQDVTFRERRSRNADSCAYDGQVITTIIRDVKERPLQLSLNILEKCLARGPAILGHPQ